MRKIKKKKDEIDEGNSLNADCEQDSDISFMNGTDEEIDLKLKKTGD